MHRLTAVVMTVAIVLAAAVCPIAGRTPSSEFTIGVSDLLDISVYGVADFSRELRVSSTGTIRMPFLGEIEVAGLTPLEAEQRLAALLDPDYVKDPQVSVIVKEPRSRMYSVLGAVLKPGQYQMLQPITLLTAIAGAGGVDLARAGDTVTIRRMRSADGFLPVRSADSATMPVQVDEQAESASYNIEVDLSKITKEGDMSRDVPILPGDIITVPERVKLAFFVVGDVNRPGPFEFPEENGISLTRAVGMAGGPTKTSKLKDTALIRQNADGSIQKIALNLDKVLRGENPDLQLQPNDMVYVPGSVGKNLAWGMLGVVPYTIARLLVPY